MRQNILFYTDDKDMLEFKAFGGMQCHQTDFVVFRIVFLLVQNIT